jgi:hypothetical protein
MRKRARNEPERRRDAPRGRHYARHVIAHSTASLRTPRAPSVTVLRKITRALLSEGILLTNEKLSLGRHAATLARIGAPMAAL